MADENEFFRPVGEICQREIVSCPPIDSVRDVANTMRSKNISSVVVVDRGQPLGIVTDRDLRNKVVATGENPASIQVTQIMSRPLSVVREDDGLYGALYRMARERIHRLGVVDRVGQLVGIITDTDILRAQTRSPHGMILDIERAESVNELGALHRRVQDLTVRLMDVGVPVREVVKLVARLNDLVLIRLIDLLRAEKYPDLPNGFAFVVMGSEGRGEQTLSTDQDNAVIWNDTLSGEQVQQIKAFAEDLIDALISIGVPPCPGGNMAKNEPWQRSLSEWRGELRRWFSEGRPEDIVTGGMAIDLRTLYGDSSLEAAIKSDVYGYAQEYPNFIVQMARNVARYSPPLGWFGRIKAEKKGDLRGKVDLKKAGIFVITDGVKALALEAGNLDGGTHDRIESLSAAGVMGQREAEDLQASFDVLLLLRLWAQSKDLGKCRDPTNYVVLNSLNSIQRGELRLAMEAVARFQNVLVHRYNLQQTG